MDTIDQLESFFAGGVTAAKFEDKAYGTVIGGEITGDPRMQQQRDYTTGDPMTYPDGNPAMQMVVTVQTDQRDPAVENDDGQRAFYIKGQMRQAVGEALRKAGEKSLRRGGVLQIKYVEDKPVTLKNGRPGNPQKIYAARYVPPAAPAADGFFDGAAPTTRTGAPASADDMRGGRVVQALTAGTLPCPPSVPPVKWSQMNQLQQEQMYDALGMVPPGPARGASQFDGEPPF